MNITIIGARAVGKTTLCKYIRGNSNLFYIEFDNIIDILLNCKDYLYSLNDIVRYYILLNNDAPLLIKELLNSDNLLLELGQGSISSKFEDTNIKNINTVYNNSQVIHLIPYNSISKSVNYLYRREIKRKKNVLNFNLKINRTIRDYKNYLKKLDELEESPICVKNYKPNRIWNKIKNLIIFQIK